MKNKVVAALSIMGIGLMTANVQAQTVPLYETGNVLAVGVYNDSITSSDLIGSAALSDNNGVVYVDGELGDGPGNATFKYKVVYFDDGSGAEEPGWQERDFDDSSWTTDDTGLGFPIGHGSSNENGRYDLELQTTNETLYTRSIFDAQDLGSITELLVSVAGDDSAVVWLNGVYLGVTGNGVSDRGEAPADWVFDTGVSGGSSGAWDEGDPFAFTGTGTIQVSVQVEPQQSSIPIFSSGNVLAVGVYNDSITSSDLIVSAQLTDNNGVTYVDGELGDGPGNATFNYKVVYFDDGSGAEEPGWQEPGFDDSSWTTDSTGLGFPIGHGSSNENGRFDLELQTTDETLYTRSIFDAQNVGSISSITVKVAGDDSAVAWFNGVYLGVTGNGVSDRGEEPADWVFDTGVSGGSSGAWDEGDPFAFTGTGTAEFTFSVSAETSNVENWELLK